MVRAAIIISRGKWDHVWYYCYDPFDTKGLTFLCMFQMMSFLMKDSVKNRKLKQYRKCRYMIMEIPLEMLHKLG